MKGWLGTVAVCFVAVHALLLVSCIQDQDFDQLDEFRLEPVLELTLVYADYPQDSFALEEQKYPQLIDISFRDSTSVDLFSQDFFDQNLKEAEFFIRQTNEIPRRFQTEITFYDESYSVLRSIQIEVPPGSSEFPVKVERTEIFDGQGIEDLRNTRYMSSQITMRAGTQALGLDPDASIQLQSSGIFYMRFNE